MDTQWEPWVLIVVGSALCAGGWTLYRFGLRIAGFILGAGVGLLLAVAGIQTAQYLGHPLEPQLAPWVVGGVVLLLGLVSAWLFYKVYIFGVFLLAMIAGYPLVLAAQRTDWAAGIPHADAWYVTAALVLLLGLAAVVFQRYIVILLTSLTGAGLISHGSGKEWILLPCLIVGVLLQLRLLRVFNIVPGLGKKTRADERGDDV